MQIDLFLTCLNDALFPKTTWEASIVCVRRVQGDARMKLAAVG